MDGNLPTPTVNIPAPTPAPAPQRKNLVLIIIIASILLLLVIGYFIFSLLQKPATTTSSQTPLPGFQKAADLTLKYEPFTLSKITTFQLEGTLVKKDYSTWTIEKDGQTLTVTTESSFPPVYMRLPKEAGKPFEKLVDSQVGPGSHITLTVDVLPETGSISVSQIIVKD